MNKVFSFLLYAALISCIGCGGAYDAEKLYWHISRQYYGAITTPDKAPEKDFNSAVEALKGIIAKFPCWEKSAELQFFLGQMYSSRKNFEKARDEFKRVYMNYPEKDELCARALFFSGLIYEQQGDWRRAKGEYRQIKERYPSSITGLQVPLYIARYYQRNEMKEESQIAYSSAIRSYINLIEADPYGKSVPVEQYLIIISYGNQGKWDKAVDTLESLAGKYPKSEGAPLALYRSAIIYRDFLKEPQKADSLFRRIISGYPQSKLGKHVRMGLGNLSILQGNIEQAREEFVKAMEKYPDDMSLCAAAQLAVASSYEKSGNWSDALREYKKLQEKYPLTTESMQVPLIVAMHYKRENRQVETQRILKDAVLSYLKLIENNPGKDIEAALWESIANAYSLQDRWHDALDALAVLRRKYPDDPRSAVALLRMGVIYKEGLKDDEKAMELYIRFTHEYPDHNMVPVAGELLNNVKQNLTKGRQDD